MKSFLEILLENSGLRIAAINMKNGKMKIGVLGQIHSDLVDDLNDYDHHKMGFVDHKDNFMDRQTAMKYAIKNPSTVSKYSMLNHRLKNGKPNLMSHDLKNWHVKEEA